MERLTVFFNGDVDVDKICETIPEDFSGTIIVCGDLIYGEHEDDSDFLLDLNLPEASLLVTGTIMAGDIKVNDIACKILICSDAEISGMAIITEKALCRNIKVASDLLCQYIAAEIATVGGDYSPSEDNVELLEVLGEVEER